MQHMVKAFQQSLLSKPKAAPGLEIAVRYVPAFEDVQVGGDWYDAFVTGDGRMIVSVGDVAGHDGDAAATMAQLRNLLRGLAIGTNRGPAALVGALDEAIAKLELVAIARRSWPRSARALSCVRGALPGCNGRAPVTHRPWCERSREG